MSNHTSRTEYQKETSPAEQKSSDAPIIQPLPTHVTLQVAHLLQLALKAVVFDNFQHHQGIRIVLGDDVRVQITPMKKDGSGHLIEVPDFVYEKQPSVKVEKRTLGITATAQNYIREAAFLTLESAFLRNVADNDAVVEQYVELLQRWAVNASDSMSEQMNNDVHAAVAELWASVHEWKVYIPLTNLYITSQDALEFGGITIRSTDGLRKELLDAVEPIVRASQNPLDQQQLYLGEIATTFEYFNQVHSVAVASVQAVEGAANYRANITVEYLLNMLRCYIPFISNSERSKWFGIAGTVPREKCLVVSIREDNEGFNLVTSADGNSQSILLSPPLLEYMRRNLALEQVSQLASTEVTTRTPLQHSLSSGSQILGTAIVDQSDSQSVLMCVNSIDTFLYSGTERISRRSQENLLVTLLGRLKPADAVRAQFRHVIRLRNYLVHQAPMIFEPQLRQAAESLAASLFITLCAVHGEYSSVGEVAAKMSKEAQSQWVI